MVIWSVLHDLGLLQKRLFLCVVKDDHLLDGYKSVPHVPVAANEDLASGPGSREGLARKIRPMWFFCFDQWIQWIRVY